MPRIITIQDAKALDDGEIIPAMRGVVTSVGTFYDGENANGQWSIQNVGLKDDTGSIQLKFSNREEIPKSWVKSEIILCSVSGNHGLQGLKAVDDANKKTKKTTRVVRVTGSADVGPTDESNPVGDEDENPHHEPEPEPQPKQQRGNRAGQPSKASDQPKTSEKPMTADERRKERLTAIRDAKISACRIANAHRLAFDATCDAIEAVCLQNDMPFDKQACVMVWQEQAVKSLPTTIAIELTKKGVVQYLPYADLDSYIEELKAGK